MGKRQASACTSYPRARLTLLWSHWQKWRAITMPRRKLNPRSRKWRGRLLRVNLPPTQYLSASAKEEMHTLLIILLVCHAKALSTQDGVHCTFTLGNYIYQKSYHNSPDLTNALCEPCVWYLWFRGGACSMPGWGKISHIQTPSPAFCHYYLVGTCLEALHTVIPLLNRLAPLLEMTL